MKTQENSSGKPLADEQWLYDHHRAKLPERTAYAKGLLNLKPKTILDLGCASGLWLDIFDKIMPDNCSFIGIDCDNNILDSAKKRSKSWSHQATFFKLDLEKDIDKLPPSDLILAFNIFSYIDDLDSFLNRLHRKIPKGKLAIRQYDGAAIRFGPMPTDKRQMIESSLRLSTEGSNKFRHYDMDRTFESVYRSSYSIIDSHFELFERQYPFEEDFIPYYSHMLDWTCDHISNDASSYLKAWLQSDTDYNIPRYFSEVDLVMLLS